MCEKVPADSWPLVVEAIPELCSLIRCDDHTVYKMTRKRLILMLLVACLLPIKRNSSFLFFTDCGNVSCVSESVIFPI